VISLCFRGFVATFKAASKTGYLIGGVVLITLFACFWGKEVFGIDLPHSPPGQQ
jgi:hypothetical protein